MKLEIKTAKSVQNAIPELKREERTLYFLVIGNDDGIVTMNIGEKTYNSIEKLLKNETPDIPKQQMDNISKKR